MKPVRSSAGQRRAPSGPRRGFALLEALVALGVLSVLLVLGLSFVKKRRDLERERLDREIALRAMTSEWAVLRTSSSSELSPREDGPFLGPPELLAAVEDRKPLLTVEAAGYPGLVKVRLSLAAGTRRIHRIVQEGYVRPGGP